MKSSKKYWFIVVLVVCLTANLQAQVAGKPSFSTSPDEKLPARPDTPKNSVGEIKSQAEFDVIARTFHQGTSYALPHAMFVIDRQAKNKIYYVNTQKYRFHKDFLLSNHLVPRGGDVFKPIYIDENRRFIVGTIAWQKTVEKWTWELWEGDQATAEHLKVAQDVINNSFFKPVVYKPNSFTQEDLARKIGFSIVTQSDINANQEYLALNTGTAIGRVHIIDKLDDTVEIGANEIIVLNELPPSLPPVRGIIVTKPSTPLSHINILARGWNIPNVYIKDADKLLKEFDTRWIKFEATMSKPTFKPADRDDLEKGRDPELAVPPVDLKVKTLNGLRQMRKRDSVRFGSKAANLGEMINSKSVGVLVPDGFAIPFYWYDKFIKDNNLQSEIEDFGYDNDFVHNPRIRRQRLEEFRKKIQNGKFDAGLRRQIISKWRTHLGGRSVFVRSSSNSEDLPNFSGAGLYKSVGNVVKADDLIEAVKTVWASLWRFEAYEARVRNYVSQTDVYMSALVQSSVRMDRGGVMITKNPFDESPAKEAVYISVTCGHNSAVVDNVGIPEQVLFNPSSNSVVLLTASQQKVSLKFDEAGGLKESNDTCVNPATKRILTDAQVRNLAQTALRIQRVFGGKSEQDIEWGIVNGRLYIVQARPYLDKK